MLRINDDINVPYIVYACVHICCESDLLSVPHRFGSLRPANRHCTGPHSSRNRTQAYIVGNVS